MEKERSTAVSRFNLVDVDAYCLIGPPAYNQYSQIRANHSLRRGVSGRRFHCASVIASDAARSWSNMA